MSFRDLFRYTAAKVPEVTVFFWIIKVLTTGMGETTSDYLATHMNPIVAVALGFAVFAGFLVVQFLTRRYHPWIYWLSIVMVSVFGTMAADVLHVGLGVPYIASTIFYAAVLAVIFIVWHLTEKTLSIHSVTTFRREFFYWATVLATFALGTAAGDLTAVTFNWGYLTSGVVFAVLIAIPAVAHWKFNLNAIFAFWFAYVVTRPLGASFADWFAVPAARVGLGFGTGPISLLMGVVILILIGYLAYTHGDVERHAEMPAGN